MNIINNRRLPVVKRRHKINSEVRFPSVRLVGRGEPVVMSSKEAYDLAMAEGVDLVLINETADPPVVRVEDYHKFLYELEKSEKERKKKTQKNETKEVQLSAEIAEHDMRTKANKALEFLEKGDKVKVVLLLKGRQKAHPERGELTVLKFIEMVSEKGIPEFLPKMEGNRWQTIVKPKKSK